MKVIVQILTATLLAGLAAAQGAPASQAVQPQPSAQKAQSGTANAKNAANSPFVPKTNAKPAPSPAQQKTSAAAKAEAAKAKAPAKTTTAAKAPTVKAKTHPAQAKATPKSVSPKSKSASLAEKAAIAVKKAPTAPTTPAKPEETQATAQSTPSKLPNPGRRDPFLSPIALAASRTPAAACSTGKHCLVVEQIALKGIIQTKEGNIAMVENGAKRSYYLHENDALFDGSVVKISGDSVTFRQESSDYLGRPVSKEVIKKVSAPAV